MLILFIYLFNVYMKLDISKRETCKDRGPLLWMVGGMHGESLECTLSPSKWEIYMFGVHNSMPWVCHEHAIPKTIPKSMGTYGQNFVMVSTFYNTGML